MERELASCGFASLRHPDNKLSGPSIIVPRQSPYAFIAFAYRSLMKSQLITFQIAAR